MEKKIRFIIVDECMLCYQDTKRLTYRSWANVLASSPLRGSTHRDGDLLFLEGRKSTRPATLKDFEEYRVHAEGYLKDTERYEPIPAE